MFLCVDNKQRVQVKTPAVDGYQIVGGIFWLKAR